jgi:hypothetical protein
MTRSRWVSSDDIIIPLGIDRALNLDLHLLNAQRGEAEACAARLSHVRPPPPSWEQSGTWRAGMILET